MASVSAAMAGSPVSGWARIAVASPITSRDLAQQGDLVAKLALAVGQFANLRRRACRRGRSVPSACRRACTACCLYSSAESAGRACWATRVSSRRLTSPSRIWSASSTRAGGRLLLRLGVAGAARGRIDQVFGPAVERVRPEFALGDRQAVFLLQVVAELPQAADDVLLPHLVEDRLEPHEPAALEVGRACRP